MQAFEAILRCAGERRQTLARTQRARRKATTKGTKNTKVEKDSFLNPFVTFVFFVVAFPDAYKLSVHREEDVLTEARGAVLCCVQSPLFGVATKRHKGHEARCRHLKPFCDVQVREDDLSPRRKERKEEENVPPCTLRLDHAPREERQLRKERKIRKWSEIDS